MDYISNTADTIDSRNVIERITELEELLRVSDPEDSEGDYEELEEELRILQELAQDGENSTDDWPYGVTMVSDDYFTEYAEQLAEDIGAIDRDAGWPLSFIDWEGAAEALKSDYTRLDFDGATYWAR